MASKRLRSDATTIAQAVSCAVKVKAGKPCTISEMRAALVLIYDAYQAGKAGKKLISAELERETARLNQLLSRAGLNG